jgi:uncharacterized damage-inducible protein DinB
MITSEARMSIDPRLDATSRTVDPVHALMRYKVWADAELLNALLTLPEPLSEPEGAIVTAIIRHFHTVDCIFKAHLLGIPHEYTSANPAEPATLSQLQQRVSAIDAWYVEYTGTLDPRELGQVLHVKFTDGQQQRLTRADILLHLSLHGSYHRGNVGLLMKKCGVEPPQERFTTYLRARS